MRTMFDGYGYGRLRLACAAVIAVSALFAAINVVSASAVVTVSSFWGAPTWVAGSLSSSNPYGGTSFEREAGGNEYLFNVANSKAVKEGETLVCGTVAWSQTPTALTYQWLRNGAVIAGETNGTYTLTAADSGKTVQCEIGATNASTDTSVVALAPAVIAPRPAVEAPFLKPQVAVPALTGTAEEGKELTCPTGEWSGSPTFTRQWLRNGAEIAGATGEKYLLTSADKGTALQCRLIASNSSGGVTLSTRLDTRTTVVKPVPTPTAPAFVSQPPLNSGVTAKAGETLSCLEGRWTEKPTEYLYQWLRNGAAIGGATSREYKLAAADEGKAIQCSVTAVNASPDSVVAATTTIVTSPAPATTPPILSVAPTLSGTAEEGKELTCATGVWAGNPTTITRQWLRNGAAISGATGETYKLGGAAGNSGEDASKAVQCRVTASNAGGSAIAVTTRNVVQVEPTSPKVPNIEVEEPTIGTAAMRVVDGLPSGVALETVRLPRQIEIHQGTEPIEKGWSCVALTVTCTTFKPLKPGEELAFVVRVRAGASTPETATNKVTISGGGALASASANYSNAVTPATPFGLESFSIYTTDELGTPFTQSSGHPFSITTKFTLNTVSAGGENFLVLAEKQPKNIEVLLPPGLVGSPELVPQCTVTQLEALKCPPSSAVGYIVAAVTGKVEGGHRVLGFKRAYSNLAPIYNIKPPAGVPAAFGFEIFGVHILQASVRSNGDYGVTVASVNTPTTTPPFGAEVTFCANGVSAVALLTEQEVKQLGCRAATPGSTSFLESQSRCTGGPLTTTIRVNTWQDPSKFVSQTAYMGSSLVEGQPNAVESIINGCEHLSFQPTLEPQFTTTRSDEPSGMNMSFKVPQHVDVEDNVGSAVRCLPGGWENTPTSFTYQWLRNGAAIVGAVSQTYTTTASDEGTSLQCRVNASNAGGTTIKFGTLVEHVSETAQPVSVPPEPASALPAPPSTGVPTPGGFGFVGGTLTCAPGTWLGSPSLSYQWLRNGVAIAGATSSSYLIQSEDNKTSLQCEIVATNAGGTILAASPNVSVSASPTPPTAGLSAEVSIKAEPNTPDVKNTTIVFPSGLSLSPSAADGLEGCSDAQFAVHSLVGASCPEGSQIGTVKITTPLLTAPLYGQLFLGQPECGESSPCTSEDARDGKMFRLFLQGIDTENGVLVKAEGKVSTDPVTGQVTASFDETPQLPFEVLELKLKDGPRAPFATPQKCGVVLTHSEIVPWSTGGLGGISGSEEIKGTSTSISEEPFAVDWDGKGGACPETLPFAPGFTAGTTSTVAAASGANALSVSLSREDREQDLGGVTVHTPSGLLGSVSEVKLCEEPQAALGACNADSRIGTVTAGAGPGTNPFYVSGSVYLTGPYKTAPFGLSIVVPTKAGPFNLGDVVVRATVSVDPHTAELTVVSDPLPQILDGIPLRLRRINVSVDRPGFILNPTSCAASQITATITGAPPRENQSEPVKTSNVSSPFDVGGCASIPFKPAFTASTQANLASRKDGASLHVSLSQAHGEANIHSVRVELPKALPSRLTTLQKACTEQQFAKNPAGCPAESRVGIAVAHTPILPVPLEGPAYFVSHGGAKFPELILVLQGEGVTIELDGETFIDPKTNVTSSTFKTVPDAPVDSFELTLPTGPYSALAAPNGLQCGKSLLMPTVFTGQNGAQLKQNTTIKTVGCTSTKKLTSAQKLKSALKACKKMKSKTKRASCEKRARKKYAKTAKKDNAKNAKKGVAPGK